MTSLAPIDSTSPPIWDLARAAVVGYASPHTRRVYGARIREFVRSELPLTREGVRAWLAQVRDGGGTRATVNQCIRAIKVLVEEARVRRLLGDSEARAIAGLKYQSERGVRSGNWLTLGEARQLYGAPDRGTMRGRRDAAMFALLLGCLLRRAEAAALTWGCYQEREGRMVLVDITGKGGRVRSVPVSVWAQADLDRWQLEAEGQGAGGADDPVLVGLDRRTVGRRALGAGGVWKVVGEYRGKLGMRKFAPHDLRRTMAKLMRDEGVGLEQIQAILGHASVETTVRYLGGCVELRVGRAGVDKVNLGGTNG